MPGEDSLDLFVESLENRELLTTASTYQPTVDPAVGFNMVGFYAEAAANRANWEQGIESLHASGFTEVTLAVYQVLDGETGRFRPRSGPRFGHVTRSAKRADELGMSITITPLFEVTDATGDFSWRGEYDPSGKVQRRFQAHYRRWVKKLTRLAVRHDATRLNVGSELEQFVRNTSNHDFFNHLVDWVDRRFEGQIAYTANWSNYNHVAVDGLFWSNEKVDVMGISAYFSDRLATVSEADASASMGSGFEDLMTARWSDLLESELIPYAGSRRAGEGIMLVIQEFGVTPFNRASVVPWSVNPGETTGASGETLDPDEQQAIVIGLLRALDGHREQIDSVHFWNWSFASNQHDLFGMNPTHVNSSQSTAMAIQTFIDSAAG